MATDLKRAPTVAFSEADRAALVKGAAAIGAAGMAPGSSGNLSLRRRERVLITPRGAELVEIEPAALVDVALRDGTVSPDHAAPSRPSSESALHRAIYEVVEAAAVVHTHSHYATVMSTLVDELPAVHYATMAFGGPVRVARYECFGTAALAASVTDALAGRRAALMANHGAVVAGTDVRHAVSLAIALEWHASVAYHALVAGSPRTLTPAQLQDVADQSRALRYGER